MGHREPPRYCLATVYTTPLARADLGQEAATWVEEGKRLRRLMGEMSEAQAEAPIGGTSDKSGLS
jgi:hypothetical protein